MENAAVPWCPSDFPSSLVHPLETKPPTPGVDFILHPRYGNPEYDTVPASPREQQFRHSSWAILRLRTYDALRRCNVGEKRIDAFVNCGGGAWLYRSAAGDDLSIKCNKCHDRWCLACARERAGKITANLLAVLTAKNCRFITLTLRHSHTPLSSQIDRLYRSFAVFRRRRSWLQHVKGGAAFLEVKIGDDGLWHPHLHICAEGTWFDQKLISSEWLAVTGDSSIVHVKPIDSDEKGASYCTKYLTKPASHDVYNDPEKLDEMVCALRGRRLCMTFGTWRGVKLEPKDTDTVEWVSLGSLDTLRFKASQGDTECLSLMQAAARKWPLFAQWLLPPDPQPPARP